MQLLYSVLFLTIFMGVSCEDLTPLKKEEYCLEGTPVTLSYNYSRTASAGDEFYWYHQDTAQRPEFLLYISDSGSSDSVGGEQSHIHPHTQHPYTPTVALTGKNVMNGHSVNNSHEESHDHLDNFQWWKELEIRLVSKQTIDAQAQQAIDGKTLHWQQVLQRLMALIGLMATQNIAATWDHLALRGTTDRLNEANNGNFLKFMELLGIFDLISGP
ncbi:hypothetical protein J4Q44_G00186820 [Coregonus suidteri]|uniref:Uncharacterized protein n=1 Tax=Coregonus suidteri TaxID=861788 RepID=A0AAN8R2Z9_9TELE